MAEERVDGGKEEAWAEWREEERRRREEWRGSEGDGGIRIRLET